MATRSTTADVSEDIRNRRRTAPPPTGANSTDQIAAIDADWDDAATLEVLTLPSGKRVQVRPVSLLSMIANDLLPNELLAAAQRSAGIETASAGTTDSASNGGAEETQAREGMKLIDLMVCELCARPQFVNKPPAQCAPGERSVHTMWDSDKTWLFNIALRGQAALKSGGPE